jgi:hypothetical protein
MRGATTTGADIGLKAASRINPQAATACPTFHREPRQVGFRTFLLEPTPSCVKRGTTVQSSPFFPLRHNAPRKTQKTNGSRKSSGIASRLYGIKLEVNLAQSEGIQAALNSLLLSRNDDYRAASLLLTIIMKGVFSTWLSRGRES